MGTYAEVVEIFTRQQSKKALWEGYTEQIRCSHEFSLVGTLRARWEMHSVLDGLAGSERNSCCKREIFLCQMEEYISVALQFRGRLNVLQTNTRYTSTNEVVNKLPSAGEVCHLEYELIPFPTEMGVLDHRLMYPALFRCCKGETEAVRRTRQVRRVVSGKCARGLLPWYLYCCPRANLSSHPPETT
jgi:hypothetical protein